MFEPVRINEENPVFTSLTVAEPEEQKVLFNAVENPDGKISEFINKKITIKHVYMEQAEIAERDDAGEPTGNFATVIKSVIITPEGKSYMSTAKGIANGLMRLFTIYGMPDMWEEPITVEVQQKEIGKNRTFKLRVV